MNKFAWIVAVSLCAASTGAMAQAGANPEHDHQHGAPTPAPTPTPPPADGTKGMGGMESMGSGHRMEIMQPTAANPFPRAEMKMHMAMMHAAGSDADETFVRKMIEHHRGATEMARMIAASTKDDRVRQFANDTIAAQSQEIAQLQAWLAQHGKPAQ